ncbi:acyl--CoA ligase [Arthrobacter sp. I2-34]|uniref:Acyl--CoA ligase n=1 Tax=Arthrobacter hankyongi TaxID=2904801 RepID=A0ABS9LA15_9MICC|nr:class I adenylate-forming enzyme family protein [Arthrobacter hankyongi]MCG2623428.1 acyl--CoA ligase [Arthrobacter hankyongi]
MRLFDDQAVSEFIAQGWWTGDTWGDCLRRSVIRFPDRECLTDAPNKAAFMGQAPLRLTWTEFEAAVDRCAEILYGHGIRKDDVVGVQIPNSVELMITYLALNRLGAILSPYPVAYRRHELSQLAPIAGVHAIVTTAGFSGRDLREDAAAVLAGAQARGGLFAWHAEDGGQCHGLDLVDVLKGPRGDIEYGAYVHALQPHPNDCAMILFTSGTTGAPKGVPRGHGDSLVSASATVAAPGLTYRDVVLAPMPMVNGGALSGMFLPWLLTGCRLVLHQPFNLEIFAAQIESESVTYSVAPPTILNDMVSDDTIFTRYDLSSLRVLGSGSAPLSAWMIKRWEADHGVEIINYFGATEGVQLFADRDAVPDPGLRARYLPKPGSPLFPWRTEVGRRSESRLVDTETGEEVTRPGRHGELRVKGPNIFCGYLHGAGDAFDELGFYRTGDLFEYSPDHPDLLILVDRAKDVIIRGGLNISAAEIEALLVAHPKVAEVAAVGRKDARLGERTCVFVVPRRQADPPTLAELVDFLNEEQVAKYKLPEFLELIEAMPRNPAGKALKVQLRRMVNGGDGSATGQ